MHKPPLLLLQSNNNSEHLKDLGAAFAAEDPPINIRAIGGGEFNGKGVFAIAIDDDTPERLERVAEIVDSLDGITYTDLDGVTFELNHEPGSLGLAAGVLESAQINILSLLIIGAHGDQAIVLAGVANTQVAASAREALENAGYFVYPGEHDHAT